MTSDDDGELRWTPRSSPRSLRRTLGPQRAGYGDPTTRISDGRCVRATLTPDGPGTLLLTWRRDPAPVDECGLDAEAWGPGRNWLLSRVDSITGASDSAIEYDGAHPAVTRALTAHRTARIGASSSAWHLLLPTILAQRITAGEAVRQWQHLCYELGEAPPGPAELVEGMRLPPDPSTLYRRPAWWFHPLGVETKRARALTEVARHADKLWRWTEQGAHELGEKLSLIPGVGVWTIGSVLGPVCGDPDAVPVGDYHFPNTVAWAIAGEARADDDRMLELLAPYRGQRGRVLSAIVSTAGGAPKFGPRQRIMPIARW